MKVSAQPADWPTSLNQEEVRQKLFFERIIELCGEPGMYEMPRIRGTKYFKMALELHNNHEITIASDALYPASSNAWLDRIYNGTRGLTDEFLKRICYCQFLVARLTPIRPLLLQTIILAIRIK